MRPWLLLLILLSTSILASTPEEQARTVIDRLDSAQKAKDADAVGRLLADDCIVIMADPSGGAKAARFLTKQNYLGALKKRSAAVSATLGCSTIQAITSFPSGDVCVARDAEGRSRVGSAVDWIRSRE
jgi:ketosteroid isomerase-like protein